MLVAPRGSGTRPTSDRLRETLFNIVAPRIEGCRFADLYAGTGAVGIEALSRGAAYVLFVEKAPTALTSLRTNLAALEIRAAHAVEARSVIAALDRMAAAASPGSVLDLVFLDPPWEAADEYSAILERLGSTAGEVLLSPDALIVAEHASRTALSPSFGSLLQTRTVRQGDAALTFYQRSGNPGS